MPQATPEENICTRLAGAPTFHPVTADLFVDDWGLDAGDIVGVKQGDTTYNVPIYSLALDWHGMPTAQIQSTGNKERKPLPALKRKQYGGGRSSYRRDKEMETEITTRFVQDETRIGFVVEETQGGYVINAAHVVAGINSQDKTSTSYVDISADYINLTGYVLASTIEAEIAVVDALTTDTGYADTIYTSGLSASTGEVTTLTVGTFKLRNTPFDTATVTRKGVKIGTGAVSQTLMLLGTGTDSNLQIPNAVTHFGASTASGGQISIPYYTYDSGGGQAAGTINFNIADTAKYQADVGIDSLTLNGPADSAYSTGTDEGTLAANKYYQVKATPNVGNASYIKFKTPSGGSNTPDDIRIGNISYYANTPPSADQNNILNTLASSIHANKGNSGYVRFTADLDGYTGTPKYYYIPMSGI